MLWYIFFLFLGLFGITFGCGITTHIEISHRAKTYFKDDSGANVDYAKLIRTHNDALMAGSPYPDSFYSSICAKGQYHDISEDTHWGPFVNATVNYINAKYPQPWDEATEKLVVFLFGVVSHQVADILWHSLGIDQGFLRAMADINFHGDFNQAHPLGDFGGDVITNYEMNTTYIPLDEGWYIPTDDLFNIYTELYGTNTKMPYNIIEECTLILFLGRMAELIGVKALFTHYVKQSPFLLDQFERYFLGGVDDMAGWTHRIWHETVTMIEKGTKDCDIPKSTLFARCNGTVPNNGLKLTGNKNPRNNGYFINPDLNGLSRSDVLIEKTLRGIKLKPTNALKERILKKKQKSGTKSQNNSKAPALAGKVKIADQQLFVRSDYARLGEDYATGDLNFDGKPDLVVTAPGYGTVGSPQEGRVYIIYGDDNGVPININYDLDNLEATGKGQILKGWGTAQSRFGTSVSVVDINLDGADDVAIGAPAMNYDLYDTYLGYNGYVFIYFGIPKKRMVANGAANITITCKLKYCNFGYSMTSGDVNGDSNPDLVMGAPFAPAPEDQAGLVRALFADKNNYGYQYMDESTLPWGINGNQSYSWFGYDLKFGAWNNGGNVLFISQPQYRLCSNHPNCAFDDLNYTITVGRLNAYYGTNLTMNWTVTGDSAMEELGWSADIGSPFPDKTQQVIAVSLLGASSNCSTSGIDFPCGQAGHVRFYDSTSGHPHGKSNIAMKQVLQGDRAYERFGIKVKFWDVNNDTMCDLFVGAPFRTDDITEDLFDPEKGVVYVYVGGERFPSVVPCDETANPCPEKQAAFVLKWSDVSELNRNKRLGSNFAFLKSTNKGQVFVTAQHASDYARLGGAIGVYNFS